MTAIIRASWLGVFVVLSLVAAARAENPPAKATEKKKESPTIQYATLERFVDQAVQGISGRYNLNEAQREETRKLWHREVERFLKEHENEVWPMLVDLFARQFKTPEDLSDMRRLGRSGKALYGPIKEAAFRAQEEWRLILTPEQRKMHDYDLIQMEKSFDQVKENLTQWADGHPTPNGLFPPPRVLTDEPPRPGQPPPGLPQPEVAVFDPSRVFDAIVEEFIKEYDLVEGQITSARSILAEFKAKANDFRDSKKEEFAKIITELRDAHERRDVRAVKKATAKHKRMLAPVYELTEMMRDRLEGLLTSAQRERHAESRRAQEHKSKAAAALKRPASTTPPATKSAAQPPGASADGDG